MDASLCAAIEQLRCRIKRTLYIGRIKWLEMAFGTLGRIERLASLEYYFGNLCSEQDLVQYVSFRIRFAFDVLFAHRIPDTFHLFTRRIRIL